MAFISNGTTIATGGSLQNVPAPSNSQILTGVASAGAGVVGSYGLVRAHSSQYVSAGSNATGTLTFCSVKGGTSGTSCSGTWRVMGALNGATPFNEQLNTVMLRIS